MDEGFDSWAVLELMGHNVLAGRVREEEIAGTKMLRIDVPETGERQAYTKFFGASAVYALTPCEEAVARAVCERTWTQPIPVHLPKQLAAVAGDGTADPFDEGF